MLFRVCEHYDDDISIMNNTILKEEQEAADAMLSINQIKKSVKQLAGSDVVQQDAVLQKLLSKYTGLLGKITGYIKTKYKIQEPEETEPDTETQPTTEKPAEPETVKTGAPDYSKTV